METIDDCTYTWNEVSIHVKILIKIMFSITDKRQVFYLGIVW